METAAKQGVKEKELLKESQVPVKSLCGWPILLGWAAMIIFAFHASTHMVGAGDTWVAMACGRHFVNHGVDTVEPFSDNSHKAGPTIEEVQTWPPAARWTVDKVGLETVKYWHPTGWLNQNWLTHVIFYWLTTLSPVADAQQLSFNSLVYWKFAVYFLATVCVYYTGRVLGAHPALAAIFACAAMFVGRSFFDIRPAGFSNLLVAVYMLILSLSAHRNFRYIWLVVLLTVFWANVHGGYIYVFISLALFISVHVVTAFFPNKLVSIGWRGISHTAGAGFAALVAAIVFNPFHLTNLTHTFVISVSKHAQKWRTVNEWHPAFEWDNPVGTGFPFFILLLVSGFAAVVWFASRFLLPAQLLAPRNEMDMQKRIYTFLSRITFVAAVLGMVYTLMYGFSFLALGWAGVGLGLAFGLVLLAAVFINVWHITAILIITAAGMYFAGDKNGYLGAYIFPFVTLPFYVAVAIAGEVFGNQQKKCSLNIAIVTAVSAIVAVAVVVSVDPFAIGLAPWSQPIERFSHGLKSLLSIKRVFIPVYEGNSSQQLSYSWLFPALYLINSFTAALWLSLGYLREKLSFLGIDEEPKRGEHSFNVAKVDIAYIAIAAMTAYMAVASRRFITISAIVLCPLTAALLTDLIKNICASGNFFKRASYSLFRISPQVRTVIISCAVICVVSFGTWWSLKFKRIYMDAWPTDERFTSIFMRMTASDVKPFYACQFMRDNNLSGQMFNYWTEGGFIAWGQNPDPQTGKTPLRLFMDGRAQAAFSIDAYDNWTKLISGTETAFKYLQSGRGLNYKELTEIAQAVDAEFEKSGIWLVLMPSGQLNTPMSQSLEVNPNWRIAFIENNQKMWVNISTKKGRDLIEGIFNGQTKYPDEFTKNLIMADYLLKDEKTADRGLDHAFKAFNDQPSRMPMEQMIVNAHRKSQLAASIDEFCMKYFSEFAQNRSSWAKQNGFYNRSEAALLAAAYMRNRAAEQNNPDDVEKFTKAITDIRQMMEDMILTKRW